MMIDRWKACGWRTNKQWRKEIKEWWEITWITLKNNIKIMKKKEKSKLPILIQSVYRVYKCLHGLLESVCSFDIGMDFVK